MSKSQKYLHESTIEEDLCIDLSILSFLCEEILLGNLDFVSLREPYKKGLFSDIDCSWERFRRRALYQVGLGLAEPRITFGPDGEHVDTRKNTGQLPLLRITPSGFMQIPVLEKEVKKYEGFNRYLTKMREYSAKIMGVKGELIVLTTLLLVIVIFVFDVKVSKIIQRIPILSSIIDTKVLQEFEAINEKDEFYQALMRDSGSASQEEINPAPSPTETSSGRNNSGTVINSKPIIPKSIEDILPEGAQIRDIRVRSISASEKLFRITLDTGEIRYIQVKKDDGKWDIVGK